MCYDGESPNVYNEWTARAKKRHRCCECWGWIEPGEKYQRARGLWDGDWRTYKTCPECASVRDHLSKEDGPCPFGSVMEYLFEEEEKTSPVAVRFLENRERRGGRPTGKEAAHE